MTTQPIGTSADVKQSLSSQRHSDVSADISKTCSAMKQVRILCYYQFTELYDVNSFDRD